MSRYFVAGWVATSRESGNDDKKWVVTWRSGGQTRPNSQPLPAHCIQRRRASLLLLLLHVSRTPRRLPPLPPDCVRACPLSPTPPAAYTVHGARARGPLPTLTVARIVRTHTAAYTSASRLPTAHASCRLHRARARRIAHTHASGSPTAHACCCCSHRAHPAAYRLRLHFQTAFGHAPFCSHRASRHLRICLQTAHRARLLPLTPCMRTRPTTHPYCRSLAPPPTASASGLRSLMPAPHTCTQPTALPAITHTAHPRCRPHCAHARRLFCPHAHAHASCLRTAHVCCCSDSLPPTASASGRRLPTPPVARIADAHAADCASASGLPASHLFCRPHRARARRRLRAPPFVYLFLLNINIPMLSISFDLDKSTQKNYFHSKERLGQRD